MLLIACVVVWAIILGVSPGIGLIVVALAVMAVGQYDPGLIDRATARR